MLTLFVRGWQGLIAYGCHSLVVVIDSNTAQTLQVLEKHKADVVKVSQILLAPYHKLSVLNIAGISLKSYVEMLSRFYIRFS